jgi:hypothetical protein
MSAARARRRLRLNGRAMVALGLAAFLVVATIVVWRRSEGTRVARQMRVLEQERRALLSQQKSLENALRVAEGRPAVVTEAERRLGMRLPSEAQTRFLVTVPATDSDAVSVTQDGRR